MIIDSSALVAILRKEPERAEFAKVISSAQITRLSAASYLETAIVIDGLRRPELGREFDQILVEYEIAIEPVTVAQARLAREAYRDFGKGSGHPARLNFGDCLSYALAKDKSEPLLFKGTDFARTDVRCAV